MAYFVKGPGGKTLEINAKWLTENSVIQETFEDFASLS